MYLDPVSEAIAHFIGHFSMRLEAAKLRDMYDQFAAVRKFADENDAFASVKVDIRSHYELNDLDPGVRYVSPSWQIEMLEVGVQPSDYWIGASWQLPWARPIGFTSNNPVPALQPGFSIQIEPPGSIAVVVEQYNSLNDDDFVTFVDHELQGLSLPDPQAQLAELKLISEQLNPVGLVLEPASEAGIAGTIITLSELIAALSADNGMPTAGSTEMYLFGEEQTAGIHINGVLADAIPKFSDFRPADTSEVPEEHGTHASAAGSFEPEPSVTIATGGNTLVNQAILSSSWAVSPEFAVEGDAISVNIINQINVWSDIDAIDTQFSNWVNSDGTPTQAFNIASVVTELASPMEESTNEGASPQFPKIWSVTTIEGNLVFLNWLEQLNLISDNDVSILTHTGSETLVGTGGNLTVNDLTMLGIGQYYDLILVGGNYYNANVINQTNIMLDNDVISAGDGFMATGEGTLATQGNLLWNQAAIQIVGSTTFADLPAHYAQALANLAAGDETLPQELLNDPAFMGLMGLRVLYISGDLIDLQYINQTNIIGDSDLVQHIADEMAPDNGGSWIESTGDNTLINIATIFESHEDMNIHVGGEVYSDALLHQAGFVAETNEFSPEDAPLASEAVLFLAEGMLDDTPGEDSMGPAPIPADGVPADVMQTILA